MREDPAVKVGADATIIDHIAARRIIGGIGRGGFDDFMIGDHIRNFVAARHFGFGHVGPRAIGPNHKLCGQARLFARGLVAVNHMGACRITLDPQIGAGEAFGPVAHRAQAQEFIEMLAVDHTDKAVLNGDVHRPSRGRDHSCDVDLCHDLAGGNVEV